MNIFERTGLPKSLFWGFLGVLIFMMGDGIEQTWLSKYIESQGLDNEMLFTVYGIAIAISSWLSGVIAETIGVRKTMWLGFAIYLVGMAGFAGLGMTGLNYPTLLVTYAIKGFAYPLFAYTFIVWITYRVGKDSLSSAQGWFWFVFTGGLNVLGAYYGAFTKEAIGIVPTLWTSLIFVTIGAIFALVINKCPDTNLFADNTPKSSSNKFKELIHGLGIMKREPKVLMGGIVRVINSISQFAFVVFMPLYFASHGMSDTDWGLIWGSVFIFNIVFNLIFGIVGDKLGWSQTIIWFGGVGCAVGVLLFYYAPEIWNNFWFILACGGLWCVMLAGYVPLSALVPSLVDKDKGAAVSVLNLGAGLATFIGPLLVKLLEKPIGYTGIVWVIAALYIVSSILTYYIAKPIK
ncbi:MAG: MFS transporter [Alistipes sp.]|nr:MFS transporter [Alistipes sp.]